MPIASIFCSSPMPAMTAMPKRRANISPGKPAFSTGSTRRSAACSASPRCRGLLRLDVGTLDVVEVLALDADKLHRRFALGRVHYADVVELHVAGMHQVGPP